jgi:hypothetical protein
MHKHLSRTVTTMIFDWVPMAKPLQAVVPI